MFFLNCFWVIMTIYIFSLGVQSLNDQEVLVQQKAWQNTMASLGDFIFIIHDWLFTEQYLSASLMMPIAIDMFEKEGSFMDVKSDQRKARIALRAHNVFFYLITIAWLTVASITDNFLWRMAISMIFLYITTVFLWSLSRIRNFLKSKELDQSSFKTNSRLLNINLMTFSGEWIVFGILFALAGASRNSKDDEEFSTYDCRVLLAFDFFYWMLWMTFLIRTIITSYMNVKFSRSLNQTNQQFLLVFFNHSNETVQKHILKEQASADLIDKNREARRQKFYKQYADD